MSRERAIASGFATGKERARCWNRKARNRRHTTGEITKKKHSGNYAAEAVARPIFQPSRVFLRLSTVRVICSSVFPRRHLKRRSVPAIVAKVSISQSAQGRHGTEHRHGSVLESATLGLETTRQQGTTPTCCREEVSWRTPRRRRRRRRAAAARSSSGDPCQRTDHSELKAPRPFS